MDSVCLLKVKENQLPSARTAPLWLTEKQVKSSQSQLVKVLCLTRVFSKQACRSTISIWRARLCWMQGAKVEGYNFSKEFLFSQPSPRIEIFCSVWRLCCFSALSVLIYDKNYQVELYNSHYKNASNRQRKLVREYFPFGLWKLIFETTYMFDRLKSKLFDRIFQDKCTICWVFSYIEHHKKNWRSDTPVCSVPPRDIRYTFCLIG